MRYVLQMGCVPPHGRIEFTIMKDESKRWCDSLPNADDRYGQADAYRETDRHTARNTDIHIDTDRKIGISF
jgi:hypothetical protein